MALGVTRAAFRHQALELQAARAEVEWLREALAQAQKEAREQGELNARGWNEVERLEKSLNHTQEWYSVRWQRITDELCETDVWPRVACMMANGTAEATEPPTYAQQMNLLKHEVERLREALRDEADRYQRAGYFNDERRIRALLDKDRYGAED